jgi:hypothetical protein
MRFDRRRFLQGAFGLTVALPFLESIHMPRGHAGPPQPSRFAFFVRCGNGVAQAWDDRETDQFWPHEPGALTRTTMMTRDADRATGELANFAEKISLVRGLNRPFSTPTCGHSDSIVQVLTASNPIAGTGNNALAQGPSLDWRIARQLSPGRDPMTLMAGPASAYIREAISWRNAGERTNAERSPLNQFRRLMGVMSLPPDVRERLARRQNSVNDLVREELNALRSRRDLGRLDRSRLDQHFEAIRDTEVSLLQCEADPAFEGRLGAIADVEREDVRPEVVRLHMEVFALAAACGQARSGTLQIGEGNDQTQYVWEGVTLPRFHHISHRINSDGAEGTPIPNAANLHHQVDRIQMRLFAHLLESLSRYGSSTGTGTLLDDGVCVWTNDLANGPPHGGNNMPFILAGGAGGNLRTGQFVDVGGRTTNVILNTIGSAVGCTKDDGSPMDDFGDASLTRGRVDALVLG